MLNQQHAVAQRVIGQHQSCIRADKDRAIDLRRHAAVKCLMPQRDFIKGEEVRVNAAAVGHFDLAIERQRIMHALCRQHLLMGPAADHRKHRIDLARGRLPI